VIHTKQALNDLPRAGISLALDVHHGEFGIFLVVQQLVPGSGSQNRSNIAIHKAPAALQEPQRCQERAWNRQVLSNAGKPGSKLRFGKGMILSMCPFQDHETTEN